MKAPKMILFDYGMTLIQEPPYNALAGFTAVLAHATANKYGYTPQDVLEKAQEINRFLGRGDPATRHLQEVEVPNHMFSSFLYPSLGITIPLSAPEIDKIYWDAASPGTPTPGIEDFLEFLHRQNIPTGVITNITYAPEVMKDRINTLLPGNHFSFILPTSQYLFRKPNPRIFQLALEMAELTAEDVWYVGDSYLCDVVGARRAGLFPVLYTGATGPQESHPDVLTVPCWEALRQVLTPCEVG